MKKETLIVRFDAEKLKATKQYMRKKDADLNGDLDDEIQRLYEKYVPAAVREYIDSRDSSEISSPRQTTKPSATREDSGKGNGQELG
ncbi:hypothetical protein A7X67_16230 [Clostridium sp. W14A]|nr:hypothetical protein A7X67_16230 [Clostridium sp. W14A]